MLMELTHKTVRVDFRAELTLKAVCDGYVKQNIHELVTNTHTHTRYGTHACHALYN